MHKSNRKKGSKDILTFTDFIKQLDITDIYRIVHPTIVENTFFQTHMEYSPKQAVPGYKIHLDKLKEDESYNVCSQTTMELTG